MRFSLLAASLLLVCSCRHAPLPGSTLAQLHQTPLSFLSGEVEDVSEYALLNNQDFVYAIATSPDGERAAYTHLGQKFFQVGMWSLTDRPHPVADQNVNPYQFDVESLDYSPDGKTVVT